MKFCQKHWDALREKIREAGLYHLVKKSGEEAASVVKQQIEDKSDEKAFDPLMGAMFAIMSNALDTAGLAVMAPNEDGSSKCPVCVVGTESWLDYATRDVLDRARDLGLVTIDIVGEHPADVAKRDFEKKMEILRSTQCSLCGHPWVCHPKHVAGSTSTCTLCSCKMQIDTDVDPFIEVNSC